jgi:hypothetical protein
MGSTLTTATFTPVDRARLNPRGDLTDHDATDIHRCGDEKSGVPPVNWKQGLLRIWVVGSSLWAIFAAWLAYSTRSAAASQQDCFEAHKANPALGNPFGCFDGKALSFDDLIPLTSFAKPYVALAIGPIFGALLLGFLVAWIIDGFKRRSVD